MAEQRLIDANTLLEDIDIAKEKGGMGTVVANTLMRYIKRQSTIDHETLPIVRQLREELEKVTAERDAAVKDLETVMEISERELPGFLCGFCVKNPFCAKCNGAKWRGAQKEEQHEHG